MPLPKPRKGERKKDFVSRFMKNNTAKKEFPATTKRVGVAYHQWEKYR